MAGLTGDSSATSSQRKATMTLETFKFTGKDGVEYDLPKRFKSGILRKARKATDEMDYFFTILEQVADEKALAALDEMDQEELGELALEWFQGLTPEK